MGGHGPPPTPASKQPAAEWCEDPWEQVSATPPPEVAEAMPQELAEQVRPLGLQRKWRGRGRGRRHIFAAEAQGVQPETLRILTEGMEVMEERTYVGAASAMVARLPPRTPTQRGIFRLSPGLQAATTGPFERGCLRRGGRQLRPRGQSGRRPGTGSPGQLRHLHGRGRGGPASSQGAQTAGHEEAGWGELVERLGTFTGTQQVTKQHPPILSRRSQLMATLSGPHRSMFVPFELRRPLLGQSLFRACFPWGNAPPTHQA